MNSKLQQLWLQFDEEFLQALAHHYNGEDEAEYVQPLRDEIMRTDGLDVTAMEIVMADMRAINRAGFDVWLTISDQAGYELLFRSGLGDFQEDCHDLEQVHRRLLKFIDNHGVLTDDETVAS